MSAPDRAPRDWSLELAVKDGHKYFRDAASGGIGVADQSGHYPDETEDGVLWLDSGRPVTIEGGEGSTHIFVPLRHSDGTKTSTPVSIREAILVIKKFCMSLWMDGCCFVLHEKDGTACPSSPG